MASGDKRLGPQSASGEIDGTGSAIKISCGFRPAGVVLYNSDGEVELSWNRSMPNDAGFKRLGISSGTIANESSHTHGSSSLSNAASSVTSELLDLDVEAVSLPSMALTHNADPVTNLNAAALYAVPVSGPNGELCRLESNQDSTSDTTFSSSNDGSFYNSSSQRAHGFVKHNATPSGVAVFVDESDSDKLKADFSGAGNSGDKYVPLRMDSTVIFLKIIDADTSGMKDLYYDDNGADDAALCFIDAGTSGGTVDSSNKAKCVRACNQSGSSIIGNAAAQTISGSTDSGSAHTHSYTGSASECEYITSDGIKSYSHGFTVGADSDVNVSAETIYWIAWRY